MKYDFITNLQTVENGEQEILDQRLYHATT